MSTEQERAEFEAFASQHGLCVTEDGDLYRSHVVAWMWKAWQARAALQSQDAERIINAARVAMDESFDHDDGYQDLISIPAEKAAALSLALDEYDASRRVEEKT